jgi:hypothetical protein
MMLAKKFVGHFIYVQIYWDGVTSTDRVFIPTFTRICYWLRMAVAPKVYSSWTNSIFLERDIQLLQSSDDSPSQLAC